MPLVNRPGARQPGQHALSEQYIRGHCDVFIVDCAQASHANVGGIYSLIGVGTLANALGNHARAESACQGLWPVPTCSVDPAIHYSK